MSRVNHGLLSIAGRRKIGADIYMTMTYIQFIFDELWYNTTAFGSGSGFFRFGTTNLQNEMHCIHYNINILQHDFQSFEGTYVNMGENRKLIKYWSIYRGSGEELYGSISPNSTSPKFNIIQFLLALSSGTVFRKTRFFELKGVCCSSLTMLVLTACPL